MSISFSNTIVFCLGSIFLAATTTHAECPCTIGTGSTIGLEYAAKNVCSVTSHTDNTEYKYPLNEIDCSANKVAQKALTVTTEVTKKPYEIESEFITFLPTQWIVLRNTYGTHFIIVNRSFNGTVAGVSMRGKNAGQVYNLGSDLDTYCTLPATPDWNSSGIPDCLKPGPIPSRNDGPSCPDN